MRELVSYLNFRESHANNNIVRNINDSTDVHINRFSLYESRDLLRASYLFISANKHCSYVVRGWEHVGSKVLSRRYFNFEIVDHFFGFTSLVKGVQEYLGQLAGVLRVALEINT